jgi:23S rRNA pseudouridine2605 synthase
MQPTDLAPEGERLQKVLARAGLGSRRTCEILISEGRVSVNAEVAQLGQRVNPEHDKVEVDGIIIAIRPDLVYYLLNKPRGVISTADDPQGRVTVVDLVPAEPRVFPVGRLDADTEGLLLLTNDGETTFKVTHPSYGLQKEYLVHTDGDPTPIALRQLRKGIELEDGMTAPAKVSRLDECVVKITIHEGRNRQVRRMFEAVGFPVIRLVRTRVGPLRDTKLGPGEHRALTATELRSLERALAVSTEVVGDPEAELETTEPVSRSRRPTTTTAKSAQRTGSSTRASQSAKRKSAAAS